MYIFLKVYKLYNNVKKINIPIEYMNCTVSMDLNASDLMYRFIGICILYIYVYLHYKLVRYMLLLYTGILISDP